MTSSRAEPSTPEELRGAEAVDELPPLTDGRVAFHSYTAYDDDGTGFRPLDGTIHVFDFAVGGAYQSAEQTIAASVQHALNPNFSADGRYLTFMGLPRTQTYNQHDDSWANYLDVFVYDFKTDQVTNVSAHINRTGFGQVDEDPVLSPDGNWLAFKYQRTDIWAVQLSDYTLRQVTARVGEESGPQYSPDGQWITFWVGSGPSAYIARVPADSVGASSYSVVVDNDSVNFPGDSGVQDYFPSYWDDSRIIYTSWDTAQPPGFNDDDDIRILDLVSGTNVFAAFNGSYPIDDSDAFGITSELIGFSKRESQFWDLWYGDPLNGAAQPLGIGASGKHNLGGEYNSNSVYADFVAPTVLAHTIGDGTQQRSALRSISVLFSEDVMVDADSLQLVDPATELPFAMDPPDYDIGTHTATWTFSQVGDGNLPEGNYRATLRADKVRDSAANPLSGGDHVFSFHVLVGDADGDRVVDGDDVQIVRNHYLQTHAEGDLNGDGTTNVFDLLLAQQNQGRALPPPVVPMAFPLAAVEASAALQNQPSHPTTALPLLTATATVDSLRAQPEQPPHALARMPSKSLLENLLRRLAP